METAAMVGGCWPKVDTAMELDGCWPAREAVMVVGGCWPTMDTAMELVAAGLQWRQPWWWVVAGSFCKQP